MSKKDKNNQNINSIPKYQLGNYFKKPIKWLAHQINDYGNSKHPFITTGTSYAYAIGDEKRRHPELTEQQIHEIVNSRIKQNRKKLGLPTDNNTTPSQAAAGLALGSIYYPWLAVPDIVFDVAASIDEPSTSNNIHTIADFPETVAKFTPSKIDDYVAKGIQTLGNIDDAVSTSGRNMFSNFDKKSGKINNNADKTSVRESTNIRYRKNGGQIRKMQTAAGGPITRYETLPNIEVVGYRPIELKTYKPLHKEYPFTGHSSLDIPIDEDTAYTQGQYSPYVISVDKTSQSKDYNLITNNCADATLGALNYIFGTKEKPFLFTTPGDVRDYAINKLHGKVTRDKDGIDTILIPRNKNNAKKISKRALEWRKNKDDDTIYEFEYKQGGKMNILEFLKNGSGIHIKEKNKGKFTSYCGGKVTDECIQKGKNSSNPAIRKRATFADNARHFKHKEGGIIKAEDGTKFNWQSALTNMGTNLFSSYLQSRIQNNKINSEAEATKAENELDLNQYFWDIYQKELAKAQQEEEQKNKAISAMNDTVINSSPLVTQKIAYDKASKSYGNQKTTQDARNKAIDEQAKAAKSSVITDAISGVVQNGLGMLKDYYGSKNNNTSTTNTSNSYFDNSKYKKFGTFNPDGSMNMLGGTFTIDGGYKPNQPQLFNYQPLKLNV